MLKRLDSAAQIVQQSPERALAIVEKIDPAKLRTEEDRARYALVVSEAYYYNYVDVDSDSLTMPMMRYYLESDNHAERSRAMYQHARVAYNRGELAEAMVSLMEAEESLESVENGKLYGSVQRLKGDIYSEGCLYANALEAYTAARDLYAELGYKEHVEYQNYDIGGTLIQLHRFEDAKVVLEDVLDYAIEVNDARFICALAHELLDLSIYLDDYDMCRKYVSMFETEGVLLYGEPHFICAKAMLMAHDGELEEALALVDHAETLEEDVEWADIDYARYIIYRNCGRHDRALYWQEQSKMSQDELMLEVLEQPVLNVQVEMLKSNLAAEMRERELMLERNVTIYVASGIGFVAVVVALLLYLRYRMRRKDSEIASHIETIESLRVDLERVPHDMALSISSLYRDRFSELNELCDIYYDHSGSSRHKNMVFNKVTDTIAVIKGDAARIDRLEETVDSYRDNAMQRLKETLPRLSDRDYRVALYSFAGFSNRAIALFIDSDPVAVSKIKYNIKQKIKSVGGQDCEYLVGLLTDK
jgi:tetratricopeptide (TPR) repeat protein